MVKCRRGLTLVEILLVTVLVAMTGVVIFSTFNNGLKLWAKSTGLNHAGDVAIGLDKFGEDLRSSLPYTLIPFKGTGMRLSMATVVWTPADPNGGRAAEGMIDQLGAVEYRFDPADGKMLRRQAKYGQALKGQWGAAREVMSGLERVAFRYYFLAAKDGISKDEVDGNVPSGVMVEMQTRGGGLKRFFNIPAGE